MAMSGGSPGAGPQRRRLPGAPPGPAPAAQPTGRKPRWPGIRRPRRDAAGGRHTGDAAPSSEPSCHRERPPVLPVAGRLGEVRVAAPDLEGECRGARQRPLGAERAVEIGPCGAAALALAPETALTREGE